MNKFYIPLGALMIAGAFFAYYQFKPVSSVESDSDLLIAKGGGHHHGGHHGHHHGPHRHHGHHGHHGHNKKRFNHWHHHHNNPWFHHHDHPNWNHHHWNHYNSWHNPWHNWYWYGAGAALGGATYAGYLYDPNFYYYDNGTPSVEYEYDEPSPANIENYNSNYQLLEQKVNPQSPQYMDDSEYDKDNENEENEYEDYDNKPEKTPQIQMKNPLKK